MDERKLRIFLEVARELNFSRAAERLRLSQPAVSQNVAALEVDVGAQLLERTPNRVVVTDAGRVLVEYAERVLSEISELRRRVGAANDVSTEDLQIAASLTVADYVLPPTLARLQASMPHLRIQMEVANSERVTAALRAGQIDIGFVETTIPADGVDLHVFRRDELVVVAPGQHRWARVTEIDLDDFVSEPLIVREAGSGTRDVAEAYLREYIDPSQLNVIATISDIEAIKAAVESEMGVSILSLSSVRKELRLGSVIVRPLRRISMLRNMSYVTVPGRALRTGTAELIALLERERFAELPR